MSMDKFSSLVFGSALRSSFKIRGKNKQTKNKTTTTKKMREASALVFLIHLDWLVLSLSLIAGYLKLDNYSVHVGKRLTSRNLAFSYTLSFSSTSSSQLNWNLFKSDSTIWKRQVKRYQFLLLSRKIAHKPARCLSKSVSWTLWKHTISHSYNHPECSLLTTHPHI